MSWIACQIQTTSTGHHRSSQIVEKVVNADTRPKFVNSNHSFVSTVWSEEIKRIECRQFGVITIISAIHLSFWFFNFGSFPVSRFRIFICFFCLFFCVHWKRVTSRIHMNFTSEMHTHDFFMKICRRVRHGNMWISGPAHAHSHTVISHPTISSSPFVLQSFLFRVGYSRAVCRATYHAL